MVDAANLESRLSFEPPAPPPDDSRDAETQQNFEPAPVNTPVPAPATDSVDISDAARAIDSAPAVSDDAGSVDIQPADAADVGTAQVNETTPAPGENAEPLAIDDSATAQSSLQTAANEPITPGADNPLETNQDSSLALEEAGNDTLNETEAGRTLGQVIDVFA